MASGCFLSPSQRMWIYPHIFTFLVFSFLFPFCSVTFLLYCICAWVCIYQPTLLETVCTLRGLDYFQILSRQPSTLTVAKWLEVTTKFDSNYMFRKWYAVLTLVCSFWTVKMSLLDSGTFPKQYWTYFANSNNSICISNGEVFLFYRKCRF